MMGSVEMVILFACCFITCGIGCAIGWSIGYDKRADEQHEDAMRHAHECTMQYIDGFEKGRRFAVGRAEDAGMISCKQARKLLKDWEGR